MNCGRADRYKNKGKNRNRIMNHFGDGSKLGVSIQYYNEITPLGNAGALFKLREQLGEAPFLLLNADAVFDVDFNRMVRLTCSVICKRR